MTVTITPLTPVFAGDVGAIDLRRVDLASHAAHVVDWPVPEGRLLLRDATDHATARNSSIATSGGRMTS